MAFRLDAARAARRSPVTGEPRAAGTPGGRCAHARARAAGTCAMVVCVAAAAFACSKKKEPAPPRHAPGEPLETRPANAPNQRPAFAGQTRAPFRPAGALFRVRVVARGLEHPWAVAFLPGGDMLVTERPGRMRVVSSAGAISPPVAGLPAVDARDQGGLLDVALSPAFERDGLVYFTFAEPRPDGNGTALGRARLVRDPAPRLTDVTTVWRMTPTLDSTKHFGARVVAAPDGTLFVTLGERSDLAGRHQAQRLDSAFGKVVRVRPDGTAPADNPFFGRPGALPEIWSVGHRNVQAAALHPTTKELWTVEHGARGGDEVNVVRRGRDYGWPTITYGIEYAGGTIGVGTQKEGMEQPIYFWDPVIAPSGAAFYDADLVPAWKGSLFVGALAGKHLARLTLEGDRVVGEERLLAERDRRVRDVRVSPRGAVVVLTDETDGELLELAPPRTP